MICIPGSLVSLGIFDKGSFGGMLRCVQSNGDGPVVNVTGFFCLPKSIGEERDTEIK